TSNRTREVHDALKRRCLYHWIEHPDLDRELAILHLRVPEARSDLAGGVARAVQALRDLELAKPPGVAETIDWTRAIQVLGVRELDVATLGATLGTVLKLREDQERARAHGLDRLLDVANGHGDRVGS